MEEGDGMGRKVDWRVADEMEMVLGERVE